MAGRQLVRDLAIIERALSEIAYTREVARHRDPRVRREGLKFIQRQEPWLRSRYERLLGRLRKGRTREAEAVAIMLPEAIGVFPGVGHGL